MTFCGAAVAFWRTGASRRWPHGLRHKNLSSNSFRYRLLFHRYATKGCLVIYKALEKANIYSASSKQRPIVTWPAHSYSRAVQSSSPTSDPKMISDDELYRLAIFLGSAAMLLIILYHFLEVNAVQEPAEDSKVVGTTKADARAAPVGR